MLLPSHLRLSRHGIWYFRLVLPDSMANLLGQREIRRTLGTRCPITARHIAYRLSGRIIPLIHLTKTAMSFDPASIDPSKIRELIAKGFKIDTRAGTIEAEHFETNADPAVAEQELKLLADVTRAMRDWSPETKKRIAEEDAELADYIEARAKPQCERPTRFKEAIVEFKKLKSSLAAGSVRTYEYRLNVLRDLLGGPERLIHEISAVECIEAYEKLQDMAPHDSKRKESASTESEKSLAAATLKDTLRLWQGFFKWAIGSKRYVGPNPIEGITRPSTSNTSDGAEAFREDELKAIFQWPLFEEMKRPHQFWGPLIALYTGARANEIAQLRVKDFITNGGRLCINIEHDPAGGTYLKNAASGRTLPIHQHLLDIGLEAYLADLRPLGATRLFPHLPEDPKTHKRERYLSRDFNEGLLKKIGIHRERVKVLHSFRDTVDNKLIASKARLHPAHISDWMGHAREGTGGKHYVAPLTMEEKISEFLPALDYGLDLSEFRYQPGRWNDYIKANMVP